MSRTSSIFDRQSRLQAREGNHVDGMKSHVRECIIMKLCALPTLTFLINSHAIVVSNIHD
jgi:hypothetical protein